MERKNNYESSSCIKTKYESLLKQYECFLKPNNLYYHKYNKGNDQKKRVYPERLSREPKKTLQSLWNVLNESNYQKICHKLKFLVNDDNVSHIISDILKNAILHTHYRKYFIIVLNDFMLLTNKDVALNVINAFYKDIIDSNGYGYIDNNITETEYDLFCSKQKHKTKALNTNMLILELIQKVQGIDFDRKSYISYLLSNFKKNQNDDYYVDLYLNMLVDICGNASMIPSEFDEIKTFDFAFVNENDRCLKNKFLVEKVNSLLH